MFGASLGDIGPWESEEKGNAPLLCLRSGSPEAEPEMEFPEHSWIGDLQREGSQ